ncbi:MAG: sigma-54 dependent transcriptional regulator [Myxococcota bacterium]
MLEGRRTVLVADDELSLRKVLSATLKRDGYEVLTASDGEEALNILKKHSVDLVLTDLRMPKVDGMTLLRHVLAEHAGVPVVILTAHGTVDNAVEAMKLGAFDFVSKPFDQDELRLVIKKASATAALSTAEPEPNPGPGSRYGLIGHGPKLERVFRMIDKVAAAPSTVLITGESGTGKELVAAAIHRSSPRKDKPFIRINCAAIPRDLIESELFGYERGAFTGAVASKPGRFELADGGTLFLDEIGEIPLEMQVKLLRALQESEFERVGGVATTRVDVRLIAATNRDLRAEITQGKFREDLFHRLNVVPVELPPLRERTEDIPLLVEHFRQKYNKKLEKNPPVERIADQAIACFTAYVWPGNIRELENVMERAILFSDAGVVTPDELPDQIRKAVETPEQTSPPEGRTAGIPSAPTPIGPLKEIIRQHTETVEKDLITRALEETGGNVTQAARKLAISRKSLQNKMKELKLRGKDSEDDAVDSNPPHPQS